MKKGKLIQLILLSFFITSCSDKIDIDDYKSYKNDYIFERYNLSIKNVRNYNVSLFNETLNDVYTDIDTSKSINEVDKALEKIDQVDKMLIDKSISDELEKRILNYKNYDYSLSNRIYFNDATYYGKYSDYHLVLMNFIEQRVYSYTIHGYTFTTTKIFYFIGNDIYYLYANSSESLKYIEENILSAENTKLVYDMFQNEGKGDING